MPWQSVPLEESLPTCQRGDTFPVSEMKMLEKQTSPPDYLTEAELITLMEKHGIGGCARPPICPGPRTEGPQPRTGSSRWCFQSCSVTPPCPAPGNWGPGCGQLPRQCSLCWDCSRGPRTVQVAVLGFCSVTKS